MNNLTRVREWERIMQSEVWKEFSAAINSQIEDRVAEILSHQLSQDTLYTFERMRGERTGLALAMNTAETMYEQAKSDLAVDQENENVRTTSDG